MGNTVWMLVFVSGFITLTACSTLPDYAAPQGGILDPASADMSDVISYRTLSRADFMGEQPPPQVAEYADRIGAATCAYILTAPDTQIMIEPARSPDGQTIYRATPHHIRFQAKMNRKCSWWNPKDVGLQQDYILEHEQIHFALFELEARRLNTSFSEIKAHLHATAATPDAAAQMVQEQLDEELQKRVKGILKRSRQFDEDTSMGHKPKQQKRWWNFVHSELAATSY